MKKIVFILFLSINLFSCKYFEHENTVFPEPFGIVNDYGHLFNKTEQYQLYQKLYDYDLKTTRQITIVTVDSIKPYKNIQKYATALGQEWGVGDKNKNNGIVIVLCSPLHQIGIATGYETESILTDSICKQVIDNTMIPKFKNSEYFDGINQGIVELIKEWK